MTVPTSAAHLFVLLIASLIDLQREIDWHAIPLPWSSVRPAATPSHGTRKVGHMHQSTEKYYSADHTETQRT